MEKIRQRLKEFTRFYNEPVCWSNKKLIGSDKPDNERIFEELVFCLLTANTSAESSMKAVDVIRPLLNESKEEISRGLKMAGYRFPNKRAEYIVEARDKNLNFKALVENMDKNELREYLVENIKGLGYKEASHFLRNIGVCGLAILDKHILRSLKEAGVIDEIPKSLNRKRYLEIEQKFIRFSAQLGVSPDELDLYLWSQKTGKVLK